MKLRITVLLFICICHSLFAQTYSAVVSVFVPPVSGIGREPEDNAFFTGRLILELAALNHSLMGKKADADYTLTGTLSHRLPDARQSEFLPVQNPSSQLYEFKLVLSENATRQNLIEQTLIYSSRSDLLPLLSAMISNIFTDITTEHGNTYAWRNKKWYFGAVAFWSPRVYIGTNQSTNMTNFGFGALAEFHLSNFLALDSGFEIANDWIGINSRTGESNRDLIVNIPFTVKYVFKPGAYFLIEPYAGVHCNIPVFGTTKPPLLSWRAGLQYGIKAGQGVLIIDPCFSMDFGQASLITSRGRTIEYQRYIIDIGIGYKYGFQRRVWKKPDLHESVEE